MDFLHKIDQNPYESLLWNIPEQRHGTVNVIGGSAAGFRTPLKAAEFLSAKYPVKTVNLVLPDVLRPKLPPLDSLLFLSSTDSGSFASADELKSAMQAADFNLLIGDLSRNAITKQAVASACVSSDRPLLITRDAASLIVEQAASDLLSHDQLILLATLPQLQDLLRAVYYPKVLLLSQSLIQITETLHKFTLSYPVSLVTFHSDQLLIARGGEINVVPLGQTHFTPISLWGGELAAKIVAMNLFTPGKILEATTLATLL